LIAEQLFCACYSDYPKSLQRQFPIKEALLDIQVTLPEDVDLEELGNFYEKVVDRFSRRKKRTTYEVGFQMGKTAKMSLLFAKKVATGKTFFFIYVSIVYKTSASSAIFAVNKKRR